LDELSAPLLVHISLVAYRDMQVVGKPQSSIESIKAGRLIRYIE
jgi:hypothetical protein